MSTAELLKRKRDARPRTIVLRGELITATAPIQLGRSFLERLHRFDPKIELHWHPLMEQFLLYRKHGPSPRKEPTDTLILEWDLDGQRPGFWLIEWLQWADKYAGGATSPMRARRNYLKGLEDHEDKRQAVIEKDRMAMSEDVAKHLKWCIDGRTSVVSDWGKRRYIK